MEIEKQMEILIAAVIVMTIFLIYANSCRSYFGSGPTIFNPDSDIYPEAVLNSDYKLEPVYKKIVPKTLAI